MPNKDSFTFSDKLKKSKSLPLSKRIPSKVGGDGKAKRTLIQRAQRDLPFIIVAAAALLLLPILSRNSGTDDLGTETPMDFVAPDTSASDSGSVDREPFPSGGFKNPLDYIVSRSGKDTEETRDGISAEAEDGGYETTTPPYTSVDKEGSATGTYGPAAKGAVRNALVRKATQISALRNSKTMAAGASTGVSRSLATGSAASSGGASGPRVGTRPVALQPMASSGKGGRSETGEGLYAEAARSLGAMNRGGSKQALFDAQLKNVDGTPLGSIGGGPNFGSGAGKLGAGGAPSNNVGYKPYLPWWWDFEKQKAMKMWELWDYNFQKALSDNIIKVGTSLALCLATGSADGKVDKFLGDPGGNPDMVCKVNGKEVGMSANDFVEKYGSTTKSGEETSSDKGSAYDRWEKKCVEFYRGKPEDTSSDRKNMLDVRLRCLGLKYKNIKWLKKTTYELDCAGVGADPMSFKITASRSKHLGHYVLAKGKEGNERIIYVGSGAELDGDALKTVMSGLGSDYVVTKVVGFKARGGKMSTGKTDKYKAEVERLGSLRELEKAQEFPKKVTTTGSKGATTTVTITTEEQYQAALEKAKAKVSKEEGQVSNTGDDVNDPQYESSFTLFKNMVEKSNKAGGNPVYEGYAEDKFSVINSCSVSKNFLETKVSDAKLSPTAGVSARDTASFVKCGPTSPASTNLNPGADYVFASNITKPGKNVYAIFIESVQGTNGFIVKKVENVAGREGYSDEAGNYFMDVKVGIATTDATDKSVSASVPGTGMVYWITTSNGSKPKVSPYLGTNKEGMKEGVNYFPNSSITVSDLVDVYGGEKHASCEYKWGCDAKLCPSKNEVNTKEYCRKEITAENEGTYDVYEAVPLGGNLSVAKGKAIATGINGGVKVYSLKSTLADVPWYKTLFAKASGNEEETMCMTCFKEVVPKQCTDVCVGTDGKINIKIGTEFKPAVPAIDKKDHSELTDEDCPACKQKEDKDDDPCEIKLEKTFDTYDFKNMKENTDKQSETFQMKAYNMYSACILKNKDGSKRTGNVNIYVVGSTDITGDPTPKACTDKNSCKLDEIRTGIKNLALSEARAITAAKKLAEYLSAVDASNSYLKIGYGFTPRKDSKGVALSGFNKKGNEANYIASFNASDTLGDGPRKVTIYIKGIGAYEMQKLGLTGSNEAYRYISIKADMDNDTAYLYNGFGDEYARELYKGELDLSNKIPPTEAPRSLT